MTPTHVCGIKGDMTPTLFQWCSRKHSMSGKSMLWNYWSKDGDKAQISFTPLELWADKLGDLRDHIFKTFHFRNPGPEKEVTLPRSHSSGWIEEFPGPSEVILWALHVTPLLCHLHSGGLGSFSRCYVMWQITQVELPWSKRDKNMLIYFFWWEVSISTLNNFKICNIVLVTVVTMLYFISS